MAAPPSTLLRVRGGSAGDLPAGVRASPGRGASPWSPSAAASVTKTPRARSAACLFRTASYCDAFSGSGAGGGAGGFTKAFAPIIVAAANSACLLPGRVVCSGIGAGFAAAPAADAAAAGGLAVGMLGMLRERLGVCFAPPSPPPPERAAAGATLAVAEPPPPLPPTVPPKLLGKLKAPGAGAADAAVRDEVDTEDEDEGALRLSLNGAVFAGAGAAADAAAVPRLRLNLAAAAGLAVPVPADAMA
eukprot:COSAG01_NODE_535_length_15804_cov_33.841452_8_plen_246_part_00